jgi:hypothetical protein
LLIRVAGDNPPSSEAYRRNDSLLKHSVHRQTPNVQLLRDFYHGYAAVRCLMWYFGRPTRGVAVGSGTSVVLHDFVRYPARWVTSVYTDDLRKRRHCRS